jgi:hypothetical protein
MKVTFAEDYSGFINGSHSINAPNIDSVFVNATGAYGYAAVGRIPLR